MKIGVFDSGYGGLTILRAIRQALPQYDYLYLGDNARAPYGTHSFDVIYKYTLQAIHYLIEHNCTLVIMACNTASAKALRSIQQRDLPLINAQRPANKRVNVLGVIRPTVEVVPSITTNGHIGILATPATVQSQSYLMELAKINAEREQAGQPALVVSQQECPMWVPLIESGEHNQSGADYFIDLYLRKLFAQDKTIDTLVLGCTHYPLLREPIARHLTAMGRGEVQIIFIRPPSTSPIITGDCSVAAEMEVPTRDMSPLTKGSAATAIARASPAASNVPRITSGPAGNRLTTGSMTKNRM